MALPTMFENPDDYFKSCLHFLEKFSWIYNVSNTRFIKQEVLNNFSNEWIKYFEHESYDEFNKFSENENSKLNIPKSLLLFQHSLMSLKPEKTILKDLKSNVYFRKMSPKKLHEISKLSELIIDLCREDINILIDFGSGLGYLSEILFKNGRYKILGLECDEKRVQTAIERQILYYSDSKEYVFYKNQFITESSKHFILNNLPLDVNMETENICIIGLHSCADLTVTAMKLFFEIDNARKLIIMPCCYHKLKLKDNSSTRFENFPLSESLIAACANYNLPDILNRPFLRLACQETNSRWKIQSEQEHMKHANEMYYRGLVEAILSDDEYVTKRSNSKELVKTFQDLTKKYEIHLRNKLDLIGCNSIGSWNSLHEFKFEEYNKKYPNGEKISEALACLQVGLQDLCENIVLYDRICFMEEQSKMLNIKINVRYEKILNDKISPRCNALIAEKI